MAYSNKTIEGLLERFRPSIEKDFDRYKNHIYRVFLNCILLDSNKAHEEKYAIAAVFHDIGIWTDHTIDYLEPSIAQAKIYLQNSRRQNWIEEISLMIYWHHKISPYHGKHEQTVECFRKADWIDVSLGLLNFGLSNEKIRQNKKQFPNLGFHTFLVKETTKNFLKHPLNPLPMFVK